MSVVAAVARSPTKRPPLTHFLSIPLGHISGIRERVGAFTDELLAANPPIDGLDASIVVPPRRLHITLGVLSLSDRPGPSQTTVSSALALLEQLRPRLCAAVAPATSFVVPLVAMDIMRPAKGRATPHVLFVGPREDTLVGMPLQRVTDIVFNAFREAGLIQDDRPLKLHCTLVNTVYRKPRTRNRVPFSYAQIKSSQALTKITKSSTNVGSAALSVDLGDWEVDEIQLCEMGSYDAEGAYVSVGGVSLKM